MDDCFRRFGRIRHLDVKSGFAFVEYVDDRDAYDAVRYMDGRDFLGKRIIVEPAKSARGGETSARKQRTDYRVIVTGLNPSTSWQDLKDFGKPCGMVNFANVKMSEGGLVGVLEFDRLDDMREAVRRLDGAELRGERVRVEEEAPDRSFKSLPSTGGSGSGSGAGAGAGNGGERGRDRDDRRRSRSRSRSRSRGRDGDREREREREGERDGHGHGHGHEGGAPAEAAPAPAPAPAPEA